MGLKENEAIVHPWINKALEKAQQKVEARNFDIRKNLLKFDNVMNDQRKVIFEQRRRTGCATRRSPKSSRICVTPLSRTSSPSTFRENAYPEQWDAKGLQEELQRVLDLDLPVTEWAKEEGIADEELIARSRGAPTSTWPPRSRNGALMSCAMSRGRCCCRRSTISGASIW